MSERKNRLNDSIVANDGSYLGGIKSQATTKATYSFWKSKRIEFEDIIEAHQKQSAQRASKEKTILAIQDTSYFNFTHHQAKTWEKEFGMTCSQKYVRGLKVHSLMASTTQGVPLGILDEQIWTHRTKFAFINSSQTYAKRLALEWGYPLGQSSWLKPLA